MSTLTIPYDKLRDLLTPVLPLASKDDMLPVLTGVLVETVGRTTVTACATDRFRAGLSRVVLEDPRKAKQKPFRALIPAGQLAAVLRATKPARRRAVPTLTLTVEPRPGKHTAADVVNVVKVASDAPAANGLVPAFTLDALGGEFPKIQRLIAEAHATARETASYTAVNAAFFADFRHAVGPYDSLIIRPGESPKKAVAVSCENFLGIIMPRFLIAGENRYGRFDGVPDAAPDVLAEWGDVFPGVDAAEAGAA